MAVKVDENACIVCGLCVDTCPVAALYLEATAVVEPEKCTECGDCVEVCPVQALSLPAGGKAKEEKPAECAPEPKAEVPEPAPTTAAEPEAAGAVEEPAGSRDVWVFIEQEDGVPARVSWELLGVGRRLANDLGQDLCGVLLGHNVGHITNEAFAYGADKVYVLDEPVLERYRTDPYMRGLKYLVDKYHPDVMLLGASTLGRDLAGAVATALRTGLTADCTGLEIDPEAKVLLVTRPAFGGNIMATIYCKDEYRPQMASVRPRVMPMPPYKPGQRGKIITERLQMREEDVPTRIVEMIRDAKGGFHLADAEIIVAGGRGLGNSKNFGLLEELAEVVGGTVGASRAAVDSGWIGHDQQVGQTGTTVRPKIYFAIGISGAVQHLVGMSGSDIIIAINKDPNAPIFKVANYGIVGDLFQIVPALTEEIRARIGKRAASAS